MQNKLFPANKRAALLQQFQAKHKDTRIPVVLFFHRDKSWRNLKQFMLIAIDPTISLHQFFKTVEVKLVLEGYLSDGNRVFYMNLTHKQLSINNTPLAALHSQHVSPSGWLEITLTTSNAFG